MQFLNPPMVRGKPPILHRVAFELRYLYGYTFLDRCGRTMNAIMREAPEWIPRDQVSPQNSPLVSVANNCVFNFSTLKIDFGLEQPLESEIQPKELSYFVEQVDLLSRALSLTNWDWRSLVGSGRGHGICSDVRTRKKRRGGSSS